MSKKPVPGVNQEREATSRESAATEVTRSASPKIGEGHASAMLRQGLKELRGALYPDSNVAQPTEYGMYGTKTQGEIADERSGVDPHTRSTLDEHVQRAESQVEQKSQSRARGSRDHGSQEQQTERDRQGPELEME